MSCNGYNGIEVPAREVTILSDLNENEAYESVLTNDCESGTEFEVTHTKRSVARGVAVAFGVAALVAVVVCGALYQAGGLLSRSSMDGVVDFYAEVAPWIKPKPSVCNEGIVLDICLRLNQKPPGYLAGNPKSPLAVVSTTILADYFMASKDSVRAYVQKIGAANVGPELADYTVKCQELCDKTIASFPVASIPTMVDVGCYTKPPGLSPTCSVEVAINVLMHTEFPRGSRDKLGGQLLDHLVVLTSDMQDKKKIFDGLMSSANLAKYLELSHPDVSFETLQLEAARLFRVFPASKTISTDILSESAPTERRLKFDDSCAHAKSNTCDVPNSCEDGTDCTDCGDCDGKQPDDSCHYSKDDECDEVRYCMIGTDCSDCDTCGLGGAELAEKRKNTIPNDSCASAGDGTCDSSCAEGTDCTDCGTCQMGGLHFAPPQYTDLVFRSGAKVQALLMHAHLALASAEGREAMETFIGKDTPVLRDEIKRMTRGVSRMLDNIKYVYPGAKCKEDTYAYIDSETTPDATGKYTMNLCKAYMDSNYLVQYSSLIAAGIRAKDMLANTATLNGSPVIGSAAVKELAAKCKSDGGEACGVSVRNAQSIVHVINAFLKLNL